MGNEYELLRQKNLENNRKVLAELGLLKPYQECITKTYKVKKAAKTCVHPYKSKEKVAVDNDNVEQVPTNAVNDTSSLVPLRRSFRLRIKPVKYLDETEDEIEEYYEKKPKHVIPQIRPPLVFSKDRVNVFGAIAGIEIGTIFVTRIECSWYGVHRPTVAGIHGDEKNGCYSLALSGGYEDDIDLGDRFTYTGSGGRDLKGTKTNPKNLRTAPQTKDQCLSRGNLALTRNVENRQPVRVIRGYKLNSPYAPESGYRYDGLYFVQKYWLATGLSGFKVYKFALQRCENQSMAPWEVEEEEEKQSILTNSEIETDTDSVDNSGEGSA